MLLKHQKELRGSFIDRRWHWDRAMEGHAPPWIIGLGNRRAQNALWLRGSVDLKLVHAVPLTWDLRCALRSANNRGYLIVCLSVCFVCLIVCLFVCHLRFRCVILSECCSCWMCCFAFSLALAEIHCDLPYQALCDNLNILHGLISVLPMPFRILVRTQLSTHRYTSVHRSFLNINLWISCPYWFRFQVSASD